MSGGEPSDEVGHRGPQHNLTIAFTTLKTVRECGCAMIGQTMINVKNGARARLSTFLAGVFLMILCIVFGPIVSDIPMAALVAAMVLVSFGTFDWHSIAPRRSSGCRPGSGD